MRISEEKEELLTEPDEPEGTTEENEVSTVASIAGVTTPLGTGPTYPKGRRKKKKEKAPVGNEDWYKN